MRQDGYHIESATRKGYRLVASPDLLTEGEIRPWLRTERLGRTLQFSDTGLFPAQPGHSRHLDAARLGVPVVAAGIPTLMQAEEGSDLVVTPRELDSVIAHGAALLAAAINRALQPHLSIAQRGWLTS